MDSDDENRYAITYAGTGIPYIGVRTVDALLEEMTEYLETLKGETASEEMYS